MNEENSVVAKRAVEAAARRSYGRLVAFLAARTRDVAAAEDALSEALIAALATWPRDGIPRNPEAWLLTTASRRFIDGKRHERVHAASVPTLELIAHESSDDAAGDGIPDDRLQLLFVCAHPAIDPDMHTPLMLQTVLGLDAQAIARAFLVSPAAMSQRLVRAKNKIRHAGIPFEVPEQHDLPARLDAVLNAIYAAYGSSWDDAAGTGGNARGLAEEAIWLARVLKERLPIDPEVRGLLALMLHCEARRPARRDASGRFIPLSEQDTELWLTPLILEAEGELTHAARAQRAGRFQLEAAIQSVYAERARTGQVDWPAIVLFYDELVRISPTIGALVARAAAIGELRGAPIGLQTLDAIASSAVTSYQPYWAVRAHLLKQLGQPYAADQAFMQAAGLTEDEAVRCYLLDQKTRQEA